MEAKRGKNPNIQELHRSTKWEQVQNIKSKCWTSSLKLSPPNYIMYLVQGSLFGRGMLLSMYLKWLNMTKLLGTMYRTVLNNVP